MNDATMDDFGDFDQLLSLDGPDFAVQPPFNDLGSYDLKSSSTDQPTGCPSDLPSAGLLQLSDLDSTNNVPQPSNGTFSTFTGQQIPHHLPESSYGIAEDATNEDHHNEPRKSAPDITKPPVPCDYCAARGFECFFIANNETGCTACRSLFRECTFQTHKPKSGWLDTLDPVSEDTVCDIGKTTGRKPLYSQGASMNIMQSEYVKTQPEKAVCRFPRATTLILKRWLDAHSNNPYPTEQEKLALHTETGLSLSQISTWLANARRRGKAKCKRAASLHPMGRTPPMIIPGQEQAELNPFERWKNSPPEKEAPLGLIKEAAAATPYGTRESTSSSRSQSLKGRSKRSSDSSLISGFHPASTSSFETSHSNSIASSLGSSGHSYSTHTSRNSRQSQSRRRRRNVPRAKLHSTKPEAEKIFQCTFCTDTFHIKYDWSRHEKTLHMNLEKWVCHPLGPIVTTSASGETACVYCHAPNPDRDHLDTHNHSECADKEVGRQDPNQTFYRKDHLRQHLRLTHNILFQPWMEDWKIAPAIVRSRCGFCPEDDPATFTSWQERADHLAKHFREGARMKHWKGNHGFDPEISAQVTNAMPPFMIEQERVSPNPFSASSGHGGLWTTEAMATEAQGMNLVHGLQQRQPGMHPKVVHCWTALTQDLGLWVREQLSAGVWPTDEMLQQRARMILFEEDDPWNQTAADNAEWLALFKKAHGLLRSDEKTTKTAHYDLPMRNSLNGAESLQIGRQESLVEHGGHGGFDEEMFELSLNEEDERFMERFQQAGLPSYGM